MHLFILFPQSIIWLVTFSFSFSFFNWVCHLPHICFLPCPSHFLGTPTPWYQKSVTANRWPVNSASWGSFYWWAWQSRSPASRYLFWLPKICFCLLMCLLQWERNTCCPSYLTGDLGVRCVLMSPLWHKIDKEQPPNSILDLTVFGKWFHFVIILGLFCLFCSVSVSWHLPREKLLLLLIHLCSGKHQKSGILLSSQLQCFLYNLPVKCRLTRLLLFT